MPQVKKAAVQDAILQSASQCFRTKGYKDTLLADIARGANVGMASVYVYFPSKLHICYEVFRPIVIARLMRLATELPAIPTPRQKVRHVLLTIWRDIPAENAALASQLIQAIATAEDDVEKPRDLLRWCESFLAKLLKECLPPQRHFAINNGLAPYLIWMAFDGFALNLRLGETRDIERIVAGYCDLVFGVETTDQVSKKGARPSRRASADLAAAPMAPSNSDTSSLEPIQEVGIMLNELIGSRSNKYSIRSLSFSKGAFFLKDPNDLRIEFYARRSNTYFDLTNEAPALRAFLI